MLFQPIKMQVMLVTELQWGMQNSQLFSFFYFTYSFKIYLQLTKTLMI